MKSFEGAVPVSRSSVMGILLDSDAICNSNCCSMERDASCRGGEELSPGLVPQCESWLKRRTLGEG